jgi:hypothetical protein
MTATTTDEQLQQLIKDVQYIKDRQAILDIINQQSRGHDRHDAALQNDCFWEDGVDEHGQWITPGKQYGEWANETHAGGFTAHLHNLTTHTCEIDGDTAHCESYVMGIFQSRHQENTAQLMTGRYIDRLEKRNGEWRIVVRRSVIEVVMSGPSHWLDSPISLTFPKGTWDESDLSYTRPFEIDSVSAFWDGTSH